jgi:succinate-acetate transporter protein
VSCHAEGAVVPGAADFRLWCLLVVLFWFRCGNALLYCIAKLQSPLAIHSDNYLNRATCVCVCVFLWTMFVFVVAMMCLCDLASKCVFVCVLFVCVCVYSSVSVCDTMLIAQSSSEV